MRLFVFTFAMLWLAQGVIAADKEKMYAGDVCLARGQYSQARRLWAQAWHSDPDDADHLLRLATSYALEGSFAEAEKVLAGALQKHPEDRRISYHQALLAIKMGDDAKAERLLLALAERVPWYPNVHFSLGTIYERQGRIGPARQRYVEEVNVNSVHSDAWARLMGLTERPPQRRVEQFAWLIGCGTLGAAIVLTYLHYRFVKKAGAVSSRNEEAALPDSSTRE